MHVFEMLRRWDGRDSEVIDTCKMQVIGGGKVI